MTVKIKRDENGIFLIIGELSVMAFEEETAIQIRNTLNDLLRREKIALHNVAAALDAASGEKRRKQDDNPV